MDRSYLHWPFFDEHHRKWAEQVEGVARDLKVDHENVDTACRTLVSNLGDSGILNVTSSDDGTLDVRRLCLAREILARHDGCLLYTSDAADE